LRVWFGEDLVMLLLVQIVNFVQTVEKFGQIVIPDQYIGLHWYQNSTTLV